MKRNSHPLRHHYRHQTGLAMVIFAEDWGGHPSSTQHLAQQLGQRHDITWFNSIGLRAPRLVVADLKRLMNKGLALLQRAWSATPRRHAIQPAEQHWQPTVIEPLALPFHGRRWVRWLNQQLLKRKLFSSRRDLRQQPTLLWLSLPSAVCTVGQMNDCFRLYYCGDDFAALEGVDHAVMARLEGMLADQVDLIVVASKALADKFPADKTLYLPHGVADYFFAGPGPRPVDLPPGPVAGFYGSISRWLDQELLLETARRLPHWQFVLIGKVCCDVSRLRGQSNIHLLGEKSHQQLPDYLHHWQVSLLPFVDNAQIRACNPLKLREYLAVGTPIVASRFPALEEYLPWLEVTDNPPHEALAARAQRFARALEIAAAALPRTERQRLAEQQLDLFAEIGDWSSVEQLQRARQQRCQRVENDRWQERARQLEDEIIRRMANSPEAIND